MGGSSSKPTEETPLKRDSELLRHDEEAPESKNAVSALFEDVRERVNRDEVYKKHWKMAMQEAEVVSYLQRCVKREQVADRKQGQYYSTEHGAIKVERFAIRGKPDDLRHYGCSVAVELFLSFQLWGAALLGLMFLITLPPMIDSMSRNSLRQDCRNGLLNGGYVALLAGEGTLGSECGYAGLNVMNYPPPSLVGSTSFPLSGALGACQEYSNATFPVEPQPLGIHTNHDTYVETDAAEFCIGNHGRGRASMALSSLCGTINVLLIMLFILWMRRKANYHVAEVDKAMLTAADYAVYIAGLEKGVDPEVATEGKASLRSRLLADLQRLGLPADAVDHIAFGLVCREDLHLMREEAALVIAKKEFDQRSSLRVERGEAPHTAYSHKQEAKLLAKLEVLRRTLRERAKATPRSSRV